MKVASVSFWHLHGTDYAADAQRHPELELVGVWDDDAERGRTGAEKHSVPFMPDLATILEDETIEGVLVCGPTASHAELVTRCLSAGKHVFMEKVLSADEDEARQIVDAARDAGVVLTVAMRRSQTGYIGQIEDLIASGAVGRVTSVRVRDGHPFALDMPGRPGGILPERFYRFEEARGGALIDLCHPVYLVIKLLGVPERVIGSLGYVLGHDVDDNAAVLMSYADGSVGIAETSYVSRVTPFTIEVHGTEGSIIYTEPGIGALVAERALGDELGERGPDDRARLRYRTTQTSLREWHEVEVAPDGPSALDRWVEAVTAGQADEANLDLALGLTRVVQAAYSSSGANKPKVGEHV